MGESVHLETGELESFFQNPSEFQISLFVK